MMTTCVGLLKFGRGVRFPVRFLASRPDKKQHDRYADRISGKTVSRIVKETKEDEMLEYDGSYEKDPMDELLNTYEHVGYERSRMNQKIFRKKYVESTREANLLTWQAKQQIIHLCTKEDWSPQEIAESFPISAGNVRKLLHSKNATLTPSEILQHDKRIMRKWQRLLEAGNNLGKGPIDPELKEIVESERIKLLHNAAGASNLPVPIPKEEEAREENSYLDLYTFHYIDANIKKRDLKKHKKFEGQFLKLYQICHKDSQPVQDASVVDKNETNLLEKEAEKLKLLQALAKNYANEHIEDKDEQCDALSNRYSDQHDLKEDVKTQDYPEQFNNEWFAPPQIKRKSSDE